MKIEILISMCVLIVKCVYPMVLPEPEDVTIEMINNLPPGTLTPDFVSQLPPGYVDKLSSDVIVSLPDELDELKKQQIMKRQMRQEIAKKEIEKEIPKNEIEKDVIKKENEQNVNQEIQSQIKDKKETTGINFANILKEYNINVGDIENQDIKNSEHSACNKNGVSVMTMLLISIFYFI